MDQTVQEKPLEDKPKEKSVPAKDIHGKLFQHETIQDKPVQSKPLEAKLPDNPLHPLGQKSPEEKPIDEKLHLTEPTQEKLEEKQLTERLAQTKPPEEKPLEKPQVEKPVEAKPLADEQIQQKPLENKPQEKPVDAKPIQEKVKQEKPLEKIIPIAEKFHQEKDENGEIPYNDRLAHKIRCYMYKQVLRHEKRGTLDQIKDKLSAFLIEIFKKSGQGYIGSDYGQGEVNIYPSSSAHCPPVTKDERGSIKIADFFINLDLSKIEKTIVRKEGMGTKDGFGFEISLAIPSNNPTEPIEEICKIDISNMFLSHEDISQIQGELDLVNMSELVNKDREQIAYFQEGLAKNVAAAQQDERYLPKKKEFQMKLKESEKAFKKRWGGKSCVNIFK